MEWREYFIAVIIVLAIAATSYSYLAQLLLSTVQTTFNLTP